MLERFTTHARSATILAREEARRLGDPAVATRHLLLGILSTPSSVAARVLDDLGLTLQDARVEVERSFRRGRTGFSPDEADALQSLGIDLDEVRRTVEESFGAGALEPSERRGGNRTRIPFTSGAKKVLELAVREAIHGGHASIGTEHLLLGLIRNERCSGLRVLRARGIDPDALRVAIQRAVADGDQPGRTA